MAIVYYKNPSDNSVFGYDSETQQDLISKAKANGWSDVTASWPPPPSNRDVTQKTINEASSRLQQVSYLLAQEMQQHITPESQQEMASYLHNVANILATAQTAYINDEAYSPEFPLQPSLIPSISEGRSTDPDNHIRFVVVN